MKNILSFFVAAISLSFLFISCEDTTSVKDEASLLNLNTIQNEVGYSWFYMEAEKYDPDPDIIAQIKAIFDPQIHSFLTFSEPSCSCGSKNAALSHFIKVLLQADVPESNITMYSLQNPETEHPYSDVLEFNTLPQFYVLKDTTIIMDVQKEKSDFAVQHPDDTITFEELILEALQR